MVKGESDVGKSFIFQFPQAQLQVMEEEGTLLQEVDFVMRALESVETSMVVVVMEEPISEVRENSPVNQGEELEEVPRVINELIKMEPETVVVKAVK